MRRRAVVWGAVWLVVTALAYLVLDPVWGTFVGILGLVLVVVGVLAAGWDTAPGFDERELARARHRKEKYEQGREARERDRARWAAHQAKKTGPSGG